MQFANEKSRPKITFDSSSNVEMARPCSSTTLDLEEPLSDEADSRESDETLLCESINALDNEIDKLVKEEEQQTPRLLGTPSRQSIVSHPTSIVSNCSIDERIDDGLMKYRDNYSRLWKGYKRIIRDHTRLLSKISNNSTSGIEGALKNITYYLDDFALKISSKKKWVEKKMLADTIGNDIDTFVARKWKRRYLNILEAIDLLYGDCEMLFNHISDKAESGDNNLSPEEIKIRLSEISCDSFEGAQFQIENDTSVTLSTVFVSDLLSQLQVYRCELLDVYKKKERLIQILAQSKRQKKELKGIVYRLRTELQYASKKMKQSQETMADKLSSTINSSSVVNKRVAEATAHLQTQRKSEIIRYEDRICELEKMLREEECKRKKLHNKLQELAGNIRVFCRIRPNAKSCIKVESTDKVIISASEVPERIMKTWTTPVKCFIFDRVFSPDADQAEVFEAVQPLIVSCVDGYNVCIMAYGQTGSGKTYTMMGTQENPGVNRRAISELLKVCDTRKQWEFRLRLSVIEIYQEEARDLLGGPNMPQQGTVKLMSTQEDDVIICGLSEYVVNREEDILKLLGRAESNRCVASHLLNNMSSRSHLIVLLKIEGENNIHNTTSRGTLTLCDLAGSENITKSGATSGDRFHEATAINKSLTTLGRVFDSLRRRQKPTYRETKLTYLLKPTLGGDSKCLLFVNVRTEPANVDESVRALQFGLNAMQVIPEQTQRKLMSRTAQSS